MDGIIRQFEKEKKIADCFDIVVDTNITIEGEKDAQMHHHNKETDTDSKILEANDGKFLAFKEQIKSRIRNHGFPQIPLRVLFSDNLQ